MIFTWLTSLGLVTKLTVGATAVTVTVAGAGAAGVLPPVAQEAFDDVVAPIEQPVEEQPVAEEPVVEEPVHAEPEVEAPAAASDAHDVRVDADDPLGLGSGPHQPEAVSAEEPVEEPVAEDVTEEPVAEEPVEDPAEEQLAEPVALDHSLDDHSLNGHSANGHSLNGHSLNGHASNGAEPAPAGGDSPIFKSMRSGWLTGDADEIHETEIDRGWEIAAQNVVEAAPVAEPAAAAAVVTGLPRRAPGERLVPGSVTPPTAAKTRDPDAIRRRLQAHTAGVSRGRQVTQKSTQHTEAGPA
ncbi:MAG TPA: hypothetical protein VGV65_05155 [Nocardioides sp.]|nr:hypothetical protein [Nocardioides sp.]